MLQSLVSTVFPVQPGSPATPLLQERCLELVPDPHAAVQMLQDPQPPQAAIALK